MNRHDSDKPYVCHNALQTSLIRERIKRRISSTINCEIPKNGCKGTKKIRITKKNPQTNSRYATLFRFKIVRNPRIYIKKGTCPIASKSLILYHRVNLLLNGCLRGS